MFVNLLSTIFPRFDFIAEISCNANTWKLSSQLQYLQFVQSPIFVSSGNILDQIYLKTKFDTIENTVASVCYSDHDAVKISLVVKV